jgi:hypothetical protein
LHFFFQHAVLEARLFLNQLQIKPFKNTQFGSFKFSCSGYFTADVEAQGPSGSSGPEREEFVTAGKWGDLLICDPYRLLLG